MLATINASKILAGVMAAVSLYLPVTLTGTVDRIEQDGGDRIAVVEVVDQDTGDYLFLDIDSDTLQDDAKINVQRWRGEVVDCQVYGGNWYTVSVVVGDEIHAVVEPVAHPVGAVVWAYMYSGNLYGIAVQHQ